jgi:hypothetical protein
VELHYEPFWEGIGRGWEVMRGECSGRFRSGRGRQPVRCGTSRRRCSISFILRKKKAERGPCGSERRGRVGWADREAGPSGEGESGPVGEEGRWSYLGQKPELGQSSRNKILSNFIWNLGFWQTLEICTRRFRRNFEMAIFPKIF